MIIFTPNTVIKSADMNLNFTTVLETVYPIGAIFVAIVSTNPGTLIGIGTWVAFGEGRVLASRHASSGTFNVAAETTGGAETHTLTTTEMPVHSHTYTAGQQFIRNVGSGGTVTNTAGGTTWKSETPTGTNANAGSGGAHNNLQPYIVVYMWKRTA